MWEITSPFGDCRTCFIVFIYTKVHNIDLQCCYQRYVFATFIQGLTIDSRVSDAAPPRIIRGQRVDDIVQYYDELRNNGGGSDSLGQEL